mgnify:CR=1 FL=1
MVSYLYHLRLIFFYNFMQCFYLHHRTFISCFVVDIRINIRLNHIPFASTKPLHIQFRELIHNTSYYISSNSPLPVPYGIINVSIDNSQ